MVQLKESSYSLWSNCSDTKLFYIFISPEIVKYLDFKKKMFLNNIN